MLFSLLALLSVLPLGLANPVAMRHVDTFDSPVVSAIVARQKLNGKCKGTDGAIGVCVKAAKCKADGGKSVNGACPDASSDVKCCIPAKKSGDKKKDGNKKKEDEMGDEKKKDSKKDDKKDDKKDNKKDEKKKEGKKKDDKKTGTDSNSPIDGPITRAEIMARGQYWINKGIKYSQSGDSSKWYSDGHGSKYRPDCSGFVSMALHVNPKPGGGYGTTTMLPIAKEISWDELQEGDFVGTLGPGTEGDNGHVVLFAGWVKGKEKKQFHTLECAGERVGCIAGTKSVRFQKGDKFAKPYKYIRVVEKK